MSDMELGKAIGVLRHRLEHLDADVDAAVDRVLAAFEPQVIERHDLVMPIYDEPEQQPMVPLADLEAAWRVGAGHARRADAAEKAFAYLSEAQGEPSDALNLITHAVRVGTERDDPLILELAEALRTALRAAGEVRGDA